MFIFMKRGAATVGAAFWPDDVKQRNEAVMKYGKKTNI